MKKILVPTDFSDCAKKASAVAMEIATKLRAEIHFLHIMPYSEKHGHVPNILQSSYHDARKGFAQNELNTLVTQASRKNIISTPLLVLDNGNEKIENYIDPLNIDLIVMGSHGATGIRELVIGSNTQKIVRHSPVPVLVIKHLDKIPFKIENILFAFTDARIAREALPMVIDFVKIWNATLHLLFVNFKDRTIDDHAIKLLAQDLTKPYPDVEYTSNSIETNDEDWGIQQFADKIGADMLAVTTHDKAGFFVTSSVAENLVNHETVPVLVLS